MHDVDLRYIDGPRYIGPPLRAFRDGSLEDLWGVRRRTVEVRLPNAMWRACIAALAPGGAIYTGRAQHPGGHTLGEPGRLAAGSQGLWFLPLERVVVCNQTPHHA